MAVNLEQLKHIVGETLSPYPDVRKKAEENLELAQKTPGYASQVLQLVALSDGVEPNVRQAAAVHFKNTVKNGWDPELAKENGIVIDDNERQTIKTHLVQLMCSTPLLIQVQLSESISLIAKTDYYSKWLNLLPELVQQFNSADQQVVNGVLKTANSIFKSFRYVQRSDDLYRVILYTLDAIQAPLLSLLKQTCQAVEAFKEDVTQLKPRFETLRLIFRIAYSLVYQDLPAYFEDHMHEWMEECSKYLQPNIFPVLVDPDDEMEPGPLEKVQAAIIEILAHYASKDEEIFVERYLANFTSLVGALLLNVTPMPKHDILATTSIRFLTGLISKPMHHKLFEEDGTLRQIILKMIIPNLYFREADEERFEDDPHEFMLTEVEGSDSESRRKCSQDCLKAMCRQFEATTNICVQHINSMIAEDQNQQNWKAKDAAINLMMGVSIRAESARGVSQINPGANLIDFFYSQVLPELQDSNYQNRPVVKATSIKFVATFRNQYSQENIMQLFPLLISHLSSPIVVVHTFAAYAIERILTCKEEGGQRKIGSQALQPFLEPLFNGLFAIIDNMNLNENDYAMKCVTRALAVVGPDVLPVTQIVIQKLTDVLGRVAKNPRNPQFNHYLFESIAVLIRNVCSKDPGTTATFEKLLFEPFNIVLQMGVEEFMPYVFQVLSLLLEYRPREAGLGEGYQQLFPPLMTADLWEKGKVPALSRLLQAYLRQSAPSLVAHVIPVLGIFQKLLSAGSTVEHSFVVLNAAITYFPHDAIDQHLATIFTLIFRRLQDMRTLKFVSNVINFFAIFVGKFGPDRYFAIIEGIQKGMTKMIVKDVWASHILGSETVQRTLAKTQVVGLTKLLCESNALLSDGTADAAWAAGVVAAVKLIGSPTMKDSSKVAELADDENIEQPGRLGPLIQQGMGDDTKLQATFQSLVQANAVTLA
ncbi:hypothetical protein ACA910_012869 [Epithemia clementina (nom. ined.)]